MKVLAFFEVINVQTAEIAKGKGNACQPQLQTRIQNDMAFGFSFAYLEVLIFW